MSLLCFNLYDVMQWILIESGPNFSNGVVLGHNPKVGKLEIMLAIIIILFLKTWL